MFRMSVQWLIFVHIGQYWLNLVNDVTVFLCKANREAAHS